MTATVNDKLLALIEASGMTSAQISAETGLSVRQISRIRTDASTPHIETASSICRAVGHNPAVVLSDEMSLADLAVLVVGSLDESDRDFVRQYIDAISEVSNDAE